MNKITIISKVENGNFKRNRPRIIEAIKSFEGKDIEVTIQRKRKKNSSNQRGYFFGCIVPIFQSILKDQWGEIKDKEWTYHWLRDQFLYDQKIDENTGQVFKLQKGYSELTTTESEEFHEQCRRLALDIFDTIIPLPSEELTLDI